MATRDIKFRAKAVESLDYPNMQKGQWVYGYSLRQYESGRMEIDGIYIDPCTFSKYTGIKDKNGKEIYEGDIVDGTDEPGTHSILLEVKCGVVDRTFHDNPNTFRISGFYFERVDTKEKLFMIMDGDTHNLEIVGNIHDNKDLITSNNTAMTRKEPYKNHLRALTKHLDDLQGVYDIEYGFEKGVKWADENLKENFIKKACQWLEANLLTKCTFETLDIISVQNESKEHFINRFKEAMEE